MKLFDLLREHWIENPGCTRNHRKDYTSKLNRFAAYLEREPTVDDLTPATISDFMLWLRDLGKSAHTVNHHRTVLMLLARRADDADLIRKVPRVKKLRVPQRVPKGFDEHEMRRVIAACQSAPALPLREYPGKPRGTWTGDDWQIYCMLVWETGARPTSLRTLRFCDVSGGQYYIRGENTKTCLDMSGRLSAELMEIIERRKLERNASGSDLILDWPCGSRHLWTALKKYVTRPAGVSGALYDILKGAVSYIVRERGIYEAAKFRGHVDVKTTQKYYVVPRIAYREIAACDVLPKIG